MKVVRVALPAQSLPLNPKNFHRHSPRLPGGVGKDVRGFIGKPCNEIVPLSWRGKDALLKVRRERGGDDEGSRHESLGLKLKMGGNVSRAGSTNG